MSSMNELRIAVVTGVSKGLGAAMASVLLERGFEVVGIGRSAAPELSSERFRLVTADLAQLDTLPGIVGPLFVELAAREPSAISVLNNAAVAWPAAVVGAIDPIELSRSLAVNLTAPTIVANAFVGAFASAEGDRRLINVSSGAAGHALPGAGAYCIGKAGLEMLTQAVAAEQSELRAVTIRPGIIDTPMQSFLRTQSPDDLPSVELFRGFHNEQRLVPAEVTATTIVDKMVLSPIDNGHTYNYSEL